MFDVNRKLMTLYPLLAGLGGAIALFHAGSTVTEAGIPPDRLSAPAAPACTSEARAPKGEPPACAQDFDPSRELLATISKRPPLDDSRIGSILRTDSEIR
jgi:hypothetical protein